MKIIGNDGREVARFNRPFNCTTRCVFCWCPCCLQEIEVTAGSERVGSVRQTFSCSHSNFEIRDEKGKVVLHLRGPVYPSDGCLNIGSLCSGEFKVMAGDTEIGKVEKQFGAARDVLTDADNFGVTFPLDLQVKCKLTLLAAVFLIDYMFYERELRTHNSRPGVNCGLNCSECCCDCHDDIVV